MAGIRPGSTPCWRRAGLAASSPPRPGSEHPPAARVLRQVAGEAGFLPGFLLRVHTLAAGRQGQSSSGTCGGTPCPTRSTLEPARVPGKAPPHLSPGRPPRHLQGRHCAVLSSLPQHSLCVALWPVAVSCCHSYSAGEAGPGVPHLSTHYLTQTLTLWLTSEPTSPIQVPNPKLYDCFQTTAISAWIAWIYNYYD